MRLCLIFDVLKICNSEYHASIRKHSICIAFDSSPSFFFQSNKNHLSYNKSEITSQVNGKENTQYCNNLRCIPSKEDYLTYSTRLHIHSYRTEHNYLDHVVHIPRVGVCSEITVQVEK
jgi:hypothetical protein